MAAQEQMKKTPSVKRGERIVSPNRAIDHPTTWNSALPNLGLIGIKKPRRPGNIGVETGSRASRRARTTSQPGAIHGDNPIISI